MTTQDEQLDRAITEEQQREEEARLHAAELSYFPMFDDGHDRPTVMNYHSQTRLGDGRPAIIVDPGSVGNLAGDKWAKSVAMMASAHGKHPSYEARERVLNVSGVGNGAQKCQYNCKLPIALSHHNGTRSGTLKVPTVSNSELPGLLGLTALKNNRAIIDCNTNKLYFLGPGDYDLDKAMPAGTDVYQMEIAPSGHMVLPLCNYREQQQTEVMQTDTVILHACQLPHSAPPAEPPQLTHLSTHSPATTDAPSNSAL